MAFRLCLMAVPSLIFAKLSKMSVVFLFAVSSTDFIGHCILTRQVNNMFFKIFRFCALRFSVLASVCFCFCDFACLRFLFVIVVLLWLCCSSWICCLLFEFAFFDLCLFVKSFH